MCACEAEEEVFELFVQLKFSFKLERLKHYYLANKLENTVSERNSNDFGVGITNITDQS